MKVNTEVLFIDDFKKKKKEKKTERGRMANNNYMIL